jgi:DNA invertase Pin-like site-specific DNA recombinase
MAARSGKQAWVESGRYSDAERSGTTTMGREGLFRMLAACERGEVDVVLVEDIDRASRNAADMHRIASDLEEMGVALCTVEGGQVTDIELAFKAVQNQQFIKQNAAKTKRGQENLVASGRMSGSVAYGLRKILKFDAKGESINGLREKDPDTASVVERIHRDFDAGLSTFAICKALNAEGIPSPKGKLWTPGALLGNRNGGIGILRNPVYIGVFEFRKTQRRRRKGQIKMRFTAKAERIVTHHPDLAIIDKDLWDRNQARLADNFDRPFRSKKKNRFAFTGKMFCGSCGEPCIVSDGKFVCTGRSQKGVCTNSRRAPRVAVEQTILARIKDHLLSEELLGPCLEAYRDEAGRALAEHAARTQGDTSRLAEIDKRIANLMTQLGAATEASFASQMMLAEVDKLGQEKARLEHQISQAPRPLGPTMDTDAVVDRIRATLDDLQAALERDDREAVRATELVRGLVDRVVLTPTSGSAADGRGAGDMTVTVEGPLAALIDLGGLSVDRVTKHGHRPTFILDNATSVWRFTYLLKWRDPRLSVVYADLPVASKLLDHADVPITMDAFTQALTGAGADLTDPDGRSPAQRARNVVTYLQDHGFTRCINLRSAATGYVWNDMGRSDEEWKARVANPPMTQTLPAIRVGFVEATVVVIGPKSNT